MYCVFSEQEIQKLQEQRKAPHRRAQTKAGIGKDYDRDGVLGELILFLLVDGFFDVPMIAHKLSGKQNYSDEVKGSDGLFYGDFGEGISFAVGEAKVNQRLKQAISSALNSINRFHGVEETRFKDQELDVAPNNLSQNLSEEQVGKISKIVDEDQVAEYNLRHPIFICYESDQIKQINDEEHDADELKRKINNHLKNKDFVNEVEDSFSEETKEMTGIDLMFLFLPVKDINKFRQKVLRNIDPALGHVMGEDL